MTMSLMSPPPSPMPSLLRVFNRQADEKCDKPYFETAIQQKGSRDTLEKRSNLWGSEIKV